MGTTYVANSGKKGSISIIDTVKQQNKGTIDLPHSPRELAFPTNNNRLWFLMGSNRVGIVNLTTHQLITTIKVPHQVTAIALAHKAARAYVTSFEGETGYITIIDTLTKTIVKTIILDFTYPVDIVISPHDNWIYVVSSNPSFLIVINRSTLAIYTYIETNGYSDKIAITANGKYAYVTNSEEGHTVSVINLTTYKLVTNINLKAGYPHRIAITPDQLYAYITHTVTNRISVIKLATNTLLKTVTCSGNPNGLAMTADNQYVYITQEEKNRVAILKRSTGKFIKTIKVGEQPVAIADTARNLP